MLEAAFENARREGRAAFVPYVMAGDPDLATTLDVVLALSALGADAIEVGIPYGDPIADGPTIAAAAQRALERGTHLAGVFELTRRASERRCAPLVLFTYCNPVFQYGVERFAATAARAGAAGAIVPDIALEESAELGAALRAHGLAMPLLIAPSTSRERAARITAAATGFVYLVSRLGVTGALGGPRLGSLDERIAELRALTRKPIAVGFGISRPEQVRAVAEVADGVIVGSALVDAYGTAAGAQAVAAVRSFVEPLIAATRRANENAG